MPKVTKEVDFWKNYFYRISLIKQSAEPIEEEEKNEEIEVEEEDKPERIGFTIADKNSLTGSNLEFPVFTLVVDIFGRNS